MPSTDNLDIYRRLITTQRYEKSSRGSLDDVAAEAASDRARILFSSPFRRLQQKTQVFPLSKNAAVRSRLTHTLEVAHVGRTIARQVCRDLDLGESLTAAAVDLVETGCLMHDIGNPPFGHFGESVIKAWFRDHWEEVMSVACPGFRKEAPEPRKLLADFVHFDGNPQGIRTVARLQGKDAVARNSHGMNLLFSQVLTSLKYGEATTELDFADLDAKAGYFLSEEPYISRAREGLGWEARHPLSYIVEIADDIAYSMSDMEDAIDNGLIETESFLDELQDSLVRIKSKDLADLKKKVDAMLVTFQSSTPSRIEQRDSFLEVKTTFTRTMIERAAQRYLERHDLVLQGKSNGLFKVADGTDPEGRLLSQIKVLAAKYLYSADRVENPLRVGLSTVRGLLDAFKPLLRLSREDFETVLKAQESGERQPVRKRGYDAELLIAGLLPKSYIETYRQQCESPPELNMSEEPTDTVLGEPSGDALHPRRVDELRWEWFCRAHLVVDYITGMADDFALRTYHSVSGVAYD